MRHDLTNEERENLAALEPKLQLVRDRVGGVVNEWATGFMLFGRGGTCKSFVVTEELQSLSAHYIYTNTRISGRGLFDKLSKFPDCIHLLEDCETLIDDKKALGVLRSALHSQSKKRPPVRTITWEAHETSLSVQFTGAIIYIANRTLDTTPELEAVKTRVTVLELQTSNSELSALMYNLALRGYSYGKSKMSTSECFEVVDHLCERQKTLNRNLDMRLLHNSYHDYLQWREKEAETHWHDLIETRLAQVTNPCTKVGRAERIAEQKARAARINALPISADEKVLLWTKETGLTRRTFYRMLGP